MSMGNNTSVVTMAADGWKTVTILMLFPNETAHKNYKISHMIILTNKGDLLNQF